ncbi:ABC transporter substrate-binding protein [Tsukamurella paurometabola]|nr:iron-siderophore ABC transporter substrate-binding protein [Tsukamurella paurometabola]
MHRTLARRLAPAVVLLAAAVGVTACSNSSDSQGSGNTDVAAGGERFGTADAETAKLGTDAKPGVFPRTVRHAAGVTEIPKKPERIVVLDTGELDSVLSLGLKPVGMVETEGSSSVPTYLADKVQGVERVGKIQNVNVEAIARLKPDLILGSKLRVDKLYPQLSAIAPTVFSIRPGFPWKENFRLIGAATGEETKTVEQLNRYADNARALSARFTGTKPTISLLRFMPGKMRVYADKSLIGVILQDAGLPRPAGQNVDELAVEISMENLSKADGDYLFYSSYGKPENTGETAAITGPAWSQLGAVQRGKAFRVDDDVWYLGLGPTGASLIVQQLGEFLAK